MSTGAPTTTATEPVRQQEHDTDHTRWVLPAMASAVFLLAMLQTLLVPVLPLIGTQLHATAASVGWVTTSTLLAAAALTPLLGRMGDTLGHKPVIVAALTTTLAGSLLAATTHTIGWLIVGRVLQGTAMGVFPLAISVLRTELPVERLTGGMSVTASALGVGSGAALVAAGVLTEGGADYRRLFWLTVAMTVVVIGTVLFALPRRPAPGGRVDYRGAAVLGSGLVLLLLPISQGHEWGWASNRTLTMFAGAVVVLGIFAWIQTRTAEPLVAMRMLTKRTIATTNLAALFVGFAMFSVFLGVSYFVQVPHMLTGYGFTASILSTSVVYMLPGAVVAMFTGPVAGRFIGKYGPRPVLISAALIGLAGMVLLVVAHSKTFEIVGIMVIGNAVIATCYAAMPALLIPHVGLHETGVANSVNAIMRTIGSAIGSALAITVLSGTTHSYRLPTGTVTIPTEGAFEVVFALAGAGFALAMLAALAGRDRIDRSYC